MSILNLLSKLFPLPAGIQPAVNRKERRMRQSVSRKTQKHKNIVAEADVE